MDHGKVTDIKREARLIELRRAWFDGWGGGNGLGVGPNYVRPPSGRGRDIPGPDPGVLDGPLGRSVHRVRVPHRKSVGPAHGVRGFRRDAPGSTEDCVRGRVERRPRARARLPSPPFPVPPAMRRPAGGRIPTAGTPASARPGASAEPPAEPSTDLGAF